MNLNSFGLQHKFNTSYKASLAIKKKKYMKKLTRLWNKHLFLPWSQGLVFLMYLGVPVSCFCHPNFSPKETNMNITDGKKHIFSNRK